MVDQLDLIDGTTGVVIGGASETGVATRTFRGVLLGRDVTVTIDAEPATLSPTAPDALVMRLTGPTLATMAVIPVLETDRDSREFRPDPARPDLLNPGDLPRHPRGRARRDRTRRHRHRDLADGR